MQVSAIDASATRKDSWLHVASPVAKLLAFALVLAAVMVSWNLLVLAGIALALAAVGASARLNPRVTYALAAYPAVFALIFAVASAPDMMTGAVIVAKAVSAALAAVTVVMSTPYPQVFAPIQRLTPSIVGDALLMTYRSLFILLEKFSNLLVAVRLRSAAPRGRAPVRAARATAQAFGGLLLYSIDLSQRHYDVLRLRGYQDRLIVELPRGASMARDTALVLAALLVLATSVLWRMGAGALNPYSWLVPLAGGVMLAFAALFARRNR